MPVSHTFVSAAELPQPILQLADVDEEDSDCGRLVERGLHLWVAAPKLPNRAH
jgi:hypothetical protein